MKLQDIVNAARYSELSSIAIKDNDAAIVTFLNLGMLELYKRFPLKQKEYVVALQPNTYVYQLPPDYMYILDAFDDSDILLEKPDATLVELKINDSSDDLGVFISGFQELQVPTLDGRSLVSIIYVAKPFSYSPDDMDVEVDLPDTLINCLLHYIGYKGHLGIRGDVQAETNAHWIRFDRACNEARAFGVAFPSDSWVMAERITDRGFP